MLLRSLHVRLVPVGSVHISHTPGATSPPAAKLGLVYPIVARFGPWPMHAVTASFGYISPSLAAGGEVAP